MSTNCCHETHCADGGGRAFRRVLWASLLINAAMFLIEIVAGLAAGSVSLQADALDFLADTGNYAISLFVAGMALHHRARAALVKGLTMGILGICVIAASAWNAIHQITPEPITMGVVGFAALAANVLVFGLLWAYRSGDSNMQSVWLCSRNDVIGNCAVLLAALGVFGTGTGWPDVIVASVMGALAVQGSWQVTRRASGELREARA